MIQSCIDLGGYCCAGDIYGRCPSATDRNNGMDGSVTTAYTILKAGMMKKKPGE